MRRITFFIAATLFQCILMLAYSQTGQDSWSKSDFDSIGATILENGNVLGFSISIDSAGTTIYNGAFGFTDAEKNNPVTKDTRFDIASISKLVGVNIIMKMIEDGVLSLDQTLDELIPGFPERELAQKIQLIHLLSHTSGLQDYALQIHADFIATGKTPTKLDFLEFYNGKELVFEPGTHYQYTNAGFMMMAFIAENVSKKSWQTLINEFINQPANLDFQLLKYVGDSPQLAPIYEFTETNSSVASDERQFRKLPLWDYVIGDGGLTISTEMLAKFPTDWTSGKIIEQNSYKSMITPYYLENGVRTGYGLGVRNGEFLGEKMVGHTGGWKSTYAMLAYLPEHDISFAGLMNTDGTPTEMTYILSQFMRSFLGKSRPDYKSNAHNLKEPENFIGEYRGYGQYNKEPETITIKLKENQLYYCMYGSCEPLYYMGENRFWLEIYPHDFIEFQIEEKTMAIREYYYGFFQTLRTKQD